LETGKHQDHVIAHVLGATVLGYFEFDQAAYLSLDMGFIWTIFLDGEMGLLPQSVAVGELELEKEAKAELLADLKLLAEEGANALGLARMTAAPVDCLIKEVRLLALEGQRRILITGERESLAIETSLQTGEINFEPVFEENMPA